ncbi:MAG: hypothetical protein EZS28_006709 [Streblomastix strix]|uniref:Uncharacterized protein n=1 Tax=Streblomastix strix TaxID=222440 RepID=A0A5J4WT82_9EUKA|nr:MAG: hypothetical protein EZS28_006709 [Streblomastix strix]
MEFHVRKGREHNEKRFLASTFLNLISYFTWLRQIIMDDQYSKFNLWSFDETNVQLFFKNSTLIITEVKTKYKFRCGSSLRPIYTLSLCVSAAG